MPEIYGTRSRKMEVIILVLDIQNQSGTPETGTGKRRKI